MMTKLPTAPKGGRRVNTTRTSRQPASLAIGVVVLLGAYGCTSEQPKTAPAAPVQESAATQEQVEGTVHVCSSCHGIGGRSISPTFPRLAGQQAEYIEAQLTAFRDHTRADPHAHTYMWGMAAHLSDPLIHGLAAYFAGQTPVPGTPGDPADMAAGQKIYEEGIPGRDLQPCISCHAEKGAGQQTIPRLAGQHRDYLIEQMDNFVSSSRENEVMHENSKPLTAEEIRQVSIYLAAQ